jgi:peptidoglycan L-alanyl-D-glutamate endopeptidase CwlK
MDDRSSKNISSLDPKARDAFLKLWEIGNKVAAKYGCTYAMISGNRTYAEQDALYKRAMDGIDNDKDGKVDESDERVTKAPPGYSNHNFGIAGDFGVFKGKAYLDSSDPKLAEKIHRETYAAAVVAGLPIEWGGLWKSFTDLPHFEYKTGLTMEQKRARMREKGSVL